MDVFRVEVGFTTTRPVAPDEHTRVVMVEAGSEIEAHLIAAQMVHILGGCPFGCCPSEMPTSTKTLEIRV